ncbi:YfiR family protein [Methylotenera sp.]|uniref:YfiR family protein n=1 Tax=Methylotenera sp. TaxID=2051956 RepID=UPI0027341DE7|nr:YfiR family protein [Methylotenera sp.]MDP3775985.1 YfiR family protein [Methylotenera sp.]
MATINLRVSITMRRLACLIVVLVGLPFVSIGIAGPIPEYAMKAAFVYNFTLFTEWPTLPNNTLKICTLESDALKHELEKFRIHQPHGATLLISKISNIEAIKDCQALYLSEEDKQRIPVILSLLENTPVLTITDVPELMGKGVMIGIKTDNKRIVFEVNTLAAKKSNLYLSSKLLSLAKVVY